jgi:O-antigen/teichoic acid export membrane protein
MLGPREFGELSTAIALHQLLVVAAVLGLDQVVILRRVETGARDVAQGLLALCLVVSGGLTAVLLATGRLWAPLIGFDSFSPLLLAAVLWTAPAAAVQVVLALLLTEDRIRAFSVVSVLSAVGGLVVGLGLLLTVSRDAGTYAWGGVAAQVGAMLIGLLLFPPSARRLMVWAETRHALRVGVPIMLGGLSYMLLNAGDRVVVQLMLGAEEVGRYQIAYTVGNVIVLLLSFTGQAWAPRVTSVVDERLRWLLLGRLRDELYRIIGPVVLGATLGAPVLLRVVAPPSFRPEGLLVVVFLVGLTAFPVAAGICSSRALLTLHRPGPPAVATAVAAVVNIALNVLLLPVLGIAGAALATVLAFVFQALLLRVALLGRVPWPAPAVDAVAVMLACTALAALSTALPQSAAWNTGRFVVAVACVPWFVLALLRARREEAEEDAEHSEPDVLLDLPTTGTGPESP